eukprot:TRINITY_DN28645_c1_g2_i1.p1 TRINITY_DN28645_c1_g2~~TRINITY_DN28645_c1_g2_i1.p1  ORF type:complete len:235 (-),score=31.81 TRINITY_DN28645_c1_g2_i1:277-981(-)
MKICFELFVIAFVLIQGGVQGKTSAPDLPSEVQVSGAPSLFLQRYAAVAIMQTECAKFFPGRVCFPNKVLDAKTGRDGVDYLVSIAFKACCYVPGSSSVSNSFIVKGVYRTNPGYINLGVTNSEANLAHDACPALKPLNDLKKGDDVADAVLRYLDTQESHNSFASGSSRSFVGFTTNSKQYLGGFSGHLFEEGYSIKLNVRGNLNFQETKYEDFPVSASVVQDGNRLDVLCLV